MASFIPAWGWYVNRSIYHVPPAKDNLFGLSLREAIGRLCASQPHGSLTPGHYAPAIRFGSIIVPCICLRIADSNSVFGSRDSRSTLSPKRKLRFHVVLAYLCPCSVYKECTRWFAIQLLMFSERRSSNWWWRSVFLFLKQCLSQIWTKHPEI